MCVWGRGGGDIDDSDLCWNKDKSFENVLCIPHVQLDNIVPFNTC